jgi:hypothetical protein
MKRPTVRARKAEMKKYGINKMNIGYLNERLRRTTKIQTDQITPEMIELKKEQLTIRRLINQFAIAGRKERRTNDGVDSDGNRGVEKPSKVDGPGEDLT